MEIQNLYSFDIFLQGLFLLLCIVSGLYIVFKDNLERFKNVHSLSNFSKGLHKLTLQIVRMLSFQFNTKEQDRSVIRYFGIIPLVIAASFMLGIIGFAIADEWVDSSATNHLSFNRLWAAPFTKTQNKLENYNRSKRLSYKQLMRYDAFEQVFDKSVNSENSKDVEQLYYQAKHEVLKDKEYYNYIRKSQSLVEYSRIFALGFFFLFVCSLLNLVIMVIRVVVGDPRSDSDDDINHENSQLSSFRKIVNVSNGVIFIFNLLSICILSIIMYPETNNTESNYMSLLLQFLPYLGCGTFVLLIFHNFRRLRFSFFIYSIIYLIGFLGYFSSARLWMSNEGKVALKVYGIYRSNHTSDSISEIKFARSLDLDRMVPVLSDAKGAKSD